MGAGVIPFAVHNKRVYFLFQKVFKGRKSGYLCDFGGGVNKDYSAQINSPICAHINYP